MVGTAALSPRSSPTRRPGSPTSSSSRSTSATARSPSTAGRGARARRLRRSRDDCAAAGVDGSSSRARPATARWQDRISSSSARCCGRAPGDRRRRHLVDRRSHRGARARLRGRRSRQRAPRGALHAAGGTPRARRLLPQLGPLRAEGPRTSPRPPTHPSSEPCSTAAPGLREREPRIASRAARVSAHVRSGRRALATDVPGGRGARPGSLPEGDSLRLERTIFHRAPG